ncbi:LysR family transcriptional regulator [Noviherbaspirillum pedocola]|uniref:LysR family transcriptional regulator n=1 Tax=Noviherbaspirillum pedocola TaxID=2801341 RepID=A0A934T367_9BURK|nr:LysR family transcriptional regulator [Noviherbaspirillum pedocola]MBK4738614.1 LysR family transcriptional regulator [Noviherbaspirillum pedocola]
MKSIEEIPFDLHALQAFVAVCESGSMMEAARLLGVTQSAVSQLIKSLEAQSGIVFLDREFRPSRPTRAGRVMLKLSNELLDHARRVSTKMADMSRVEEIQIRLGCVDSFAATVGPSLVKAISGTSRQITMWSGLTPMLSEQIQGRELDLAIVTETSISDPRIRQQAVLSEAFVAAVPKLRKKQMPNLLQILQALPLIRYTPRSVIGQQVDRYLRHIDVNSSRRFEFDATDPMLSMVASGIGWAVTTPLCLWQARHYLREVSVVSLPESNIGRREFYLLSRENEWASLSSEIAQLTRQVLDQQTIPEIRKALPDLLPTAIQCL